MAKISIEVSANKEETISKHISLPISSSTGLRLVDSVKLPDCGQIVRLGVDDWALRNGCK